MDPSIPCVSIGGTQGSRRSAFLLMEPIAAGISNGGYGALPFVPFPNRCGGLTPECISEDICQAP